MKTNNIKLIAVIGINHDGAMQRAKELIEKSFQHNLHSIKFKYRNLNNSYSDSTNDIGCVCQC